MTIITPTGITGITSITSTGNTLQFQNPSGADVSVSGLNVTSGTNINVTGIVTASGFVGNVTGNINSSGVSTFSSGIIVAAGSVSAPSISPSGDSNTGIFFPDGDTVSIGEGGTEVVRVHSLGRVLVGTANTNIAGAPSNKGAKQFIYTAEGNGEWALQARHDSTTGNGLFIRAGNNSTTYTARFTGYDENNVHLNIDGLGRVTTPLQPSFMVRQSIGGSGFVGGQVANWDVVILNRGNHFKTTAGTGQNQRFIAPVAGVYHFNCMILSNSNTRLFFNFRVNDSSIAGTLIETVSVTGQYQTGTSTMTYQLAESDWVDVFITTNNAYGGVYANFNGYLVG